MNEPFEEVEDGRDDHRLSVFMQFTQDWSRERFDLFQASFSNELASSLTILDQRQLVRAMFNPDLTRGRALILCLGIDPHTPFQTLPGSCQLDIMLALDNVVSMEAWKQPRDLIQNFDTKLQPGKFTCFDEVLSLLSGTEFPVDENVKTCWRSIRNLDMPGRAMEPFIADEIIEKLFGDDEVDLRSQNTEELERLKATIKVLKSKIASLEDNEPKARISLEKIALGLALHRANYKPEASRQEAIKTIVKWIETVGLRIDAKTVRARLRDAYTNHSDDVDEWLRDEK